MSFISSDSNFDVVPFCFPEIEILLIGWLVSVVIK